MPAAHGGSIRTPIILVLYSSPLGAGAASDTQLKRDIVLIGRPDDGLGLYRYRYLWSDTVYVGVMAQEVALIRPDTIVRDALDDYLKVDYGRLGMRLMTPPERGREKQRCEPFVSYRCVEKDRREAVIFVCRSRCSA